MKPLARMVGHANHRFLPYVEQTNERLQREYGLYVLGSDKYKNTIHCGLIMKTQTCMNDCMPTFVDILTVFNYAHSNLVLKHMVPPFHRVH